MTSIATRDEPHRLDHDEFLEEVHSFEFWFQAVEGYLSDRPYGCLPATQDLELAGERLDGLITTLCNYCVGETAALEAANSMIAFAPNRRSGRTTSGDA